MSDITFSVVGEQQDQKHAADAYGDGEHKNALIG